MPETRNPTLREQYPNACVVDHVTIPGKQMGQCCVLGCGRPASRNLRQGEATGPVVAVSCVEHAQELLRGHLVTNRGLCAGDVSFAMLIYGPEADQPMGKVPVKKRRVFQIRRIDPVGTHAVSTRVCHCGEDAKVLAYDNATSPFSLCWGCSRALQAGTDLDVSDHWQLHWAGSQKRSEAKQPLRVCDVSLTQSHKGPAHCCVDGCDEEPGCYMTKEGWRLCRQHTVEMYLYGEVDCKTGTILRWDGSRQGAIFRRVLERSVYRWADGIQKLMLDMHIKKTEYKPETETKLTKEDIEKSAKAVARCDKVNWLVPNGYASVPFGGTSYGGPVRVYAKSGIAGNLLDVRRAVDFHEEVLASFGHSKVPLTVFVEQNFYEVRFRRLCYTIVRKNRLMDPEDKEPYLVTVKKYPDSEDFVACGSGHNLQTAISDAQRSARLLTRAMDDCLSCRYGERDDKPLTRKDLER